MNSPRKKLPDSHFISVAQMIEVDRLMIEEYQIELMQMMENAGRNLALLACKKFFGKGPHKSKVTILAGSGGNGGGALVCARHLHNWGLSVQLVLSRPALEFSGVPAHQLAILDKLNIPQISIKEDSTISAGNLIIDGLIGYSLQGAPKGEEARLINWANRQGVDILSLDVQSGVNADNGQAYEPAIKASATLTLALPKKGLKNNKHCGDLFLADISVPKELYKKAFNIEVARIFECSGIIRLI